jgi:hypothetical protein
MLRHIVGAFSLVLLAYLVENCERNYLVVLVYDCIRNGTYLRLHKNEALVHGIM